MAYNLQDNIDTLKDCRNKVAEVFESEVKDEHKDNGNLDSMTKIIKDFEDLTFKMKERVE